VVRKCKKKAQRKTLLPDGDYSADVLHGIENALAFDIYKKLSQPIKHYIQTALLFTDLLCRR
jgi:hypothetical protein